MNIKNFLYLDALSLVMLSLIGFVGLCVAVFAFRYLEGDKKRRSFFLFYIAALACISLVVCADHLLLLFIAWVLSNFFLVHLMLHKRQWKAALFSSTLAWNNFALGALFLAAALFTLYQATGSFSLHQALQYPLSFEALTVATAMLFLCACTQSAIWPFHRWLISSLNSPTPVSAVMHAGFINGGGFLLVRFAPLFLKLPIMLHVIFLFGMFSVLVGTLWKLMQNSVKRMLACSTMGQMGFMMVQCGLGLFSATIAHLCWHGLFKAYLFLSSGSAAHEKRWSLKTPPSLRSFLLSCLCGLGGAYMFVLVREQPLITQDAPLFLTVLAVIAGAQFSLPMVRKDSLLMLLLALVTTLLMGILYGLSVSLIETYLLSLSLASSQKLNLMHMFGLVTLCFAWMMMLFAKDLKFYPNWMLKAYVYMLNASQPHRKSLTLYRNHYQA